jgi:hypothetical protein
MSAPPLPAVTTEIEVRVTYPDEPGKLAGILGALRRSGGDVHAHLVYQTDGGAIGRFLCENPAGGALALREAGLRAETGTVVTVRLPQRRHTLSHLVTTLESEGIRIGYSYATATADGLLVVFRTSDNTKAEDVLRTFLLRAVPYAKGVLEAPDAGASDQPANGSS